MIDPSSRQTVPMLAYYRYCDIIFSLGALFVRLYCCTGPQKFWYRVSRVAMALLGNWPVLLSQQKYKTDTARYNQPDTDSCSHTQDLQGHLLSLSLSLSTLVHSTTSLSLFTAASSWHDWALHHTLNSNFILLHRIHVISRATQPRTVPRPNTSALLLAM